MSFEQWAIVAILLAMLVAFALERFRVEVVAMLGLAVGFLVGVVPVHNVFSGFANPAVITVVEILLVVSALSRTRVIDNFARTVIAKAKSETAVLAILCVVSGGISVFMNNIGALALIFPVALSVCARLEISPAKVLMPLSFATLLGGLCSLTGTPSNLVVNQWVITETGRGLGYFELAWLGAPIALAGLVWVVLAPPRVFARFEAGPPTLPDAGPSAFLAELPVAPGSPLAGLPLSEAERSSDLRIHGVMRHGAHVFARRSDIVLAEGDLVLAEGELSQIEQLKWRGEPAPAGDVEQIEAVVMPESLLLGSRLGDVGMFAEHNVSVTGLASRRRRIEGSFRDLQIGMGDVLVLTGARDALRAAVADCGLLALSPRRPARLNARAAPAVGIFAAGILASAFDIVPPEIAFGVVVIAMALTGDLNMRTALQDLNWPIVILLACMIPLGMAVEESGAAQVMANAIVEYLPATDGWTVTCIVLLLAVAITPFIDNVSTAVVLCPIAAGLSQRTGVPVEPLMIAVAIGASLDFLTPFGHHNNAVVMGAAGYRFMDFPRFGAPLLAICVAVGVVAARWVFFA